MRAANPSLVVALTRWLTGWWVITIVGLSIVSLLSIGYRVVLEWRRSASEAATRRAEAGANLLVTAITRDMRALQTVVLPSMPSGGPIAGAPEVLDAIAVAFAKHTYPEAFFAWPTSVGTSSVDPVAFYGRADRLPPWLLGTDNNRFTVVVGASATVGARLMQRVADDVATGRRFSVFDITLENGAYQVIVHIWYKDASHTQLDRVSGILVNIDWARRSYFEDVVQQVSRLAGAEDPILLSIRDESDRVVLGATTEPGSPIAKRTFPFLFFDPILVSIKVPSDLKSVPWVAEAALVDDPLLGAASRGARQALILGAATSAMLITALVLSIQSARSVARLATLRSEFVSTVTHELKTPIATIRMISETFAAERGITPVISRRYGRLALGESKRLSRLIDNLLVYSRINDITEAYCFEHLSLGEMVDDALAQFALQLDVVDRQLIVDLPADLPLIRADRTSLTLLLSNLIDNALRYSDGTPHLTIRARHEGNDVILQVTDRGRGIPAAEIQHVTRKFYRGSGSKSGGSGLGLTIVSRIVQAHSGKLDFRSTVGMGTTVTVSLPA